MFSVVIIVLEELSIVNCLVKGFAVFQWESVIG